MGGEQLAEHTHTYTASREPSSAGYGIWGGQTPPLTVDQLPRHTHDKCGVWINASYGQSFISNEAKDVDNDSFYTGSNAVY